MKLGVVIYSDDPETVWNAFRAANFCLTTDDEVQVFLIGKGVEFQSLNTDKFKVNGQVKAYLDNGGKAFICGTCLEIHKLAVPSGLTKATLHDLRKILSESDKIITF